MGNETSKQKAGNRRSPSKGPKSTKAANGTTTAGTTTTAKATKHVHIAPDDNIDDTKKKKKIPMDESAHTFAPSLASASGHFRRGSSPVMITDALSDVRLNYHIEPKELGHGHYGVVRKCMNRESGEWYAIKSIRKSKVSKIEVLKREIEILKEVKHPNIIELVEVYEDERYLHLVTELCTGGELFDRIIAKTQSTEGHFSEHDAALLVNDILDAIRYCHDEKGIVHRDLKPENFLFLTEDEKAPVKIIDFGLSRHDDTDHGIMQTKVGTPYYVAPEVLRREYTNSCDVWSIGVITYILLCGYPPFYGDSDTQIFESVKGGRFDFPSPEWDEISEAAKDFVVQLLKKNPAERPSAALAMKHAWLKEQKVGVDKDMKERRLSLHNSSRTGEFTKYLAMKKLKKAALGYIATNLTNDEVGKLEEIFRAMDTSGLGNISLTDLDDAISKGNFDQNIIDELRKLRTDFAISDKNTLNWKTFVAATMDKSMAMRADNMRLAFDHFKHTDADYLTLEDLVEIFEGEAPAREIMDLLDEDGDGEVTYEQFCHAVAQSMVEDEDEDDLEDFA